MKKNKKIIKKFVIKLFKLIELVFWMIAIIFVSTVVMIPIEEIKILSPLMIISIPMAIRATTLIVEGFEEIDLK